MEELIRVEHATKTFRSKTGAALSVKSERSKMSA